MTKLVFIENGRTVTDSLTVAETFGKEHRRVMQDIREMECSDEFRLHHFVQSSYVNEQQRLMPKYIITQDGFSFLVMGYTGKEAARFKEMYIGEFNRMREKLNGPSDLEKFLYNPDNLLTIAQNWKREQDLRIAAEEKIEKDKPLVLFAESLQISEDSILVADLAKLLKQKGIEVGEVRLFRYLRENGYLIKTGTEYNMPTQRSMELQIMEIKTGHRGSSDGTIKLTRTPKITTKGQVYFINKFLSKKTA